MNYLPLLSFWLKHHEQFQSLTGGDSTLLVDFADAVGPVLKKHFPNLNVNSILDDAVSTLHEVVGQPKKGLT